MKESQAVPVRDGLAFFDFGHSVSHSAAVGERHAPSSAAA